MSHVAVAEWQTRMLEGHVGDRAGSSPVSHTKVPDLGQELFLQELRIMFDSWVYNMI